MPALALLCERRSAHITTRGVSPNAGYKTDIERASLFATACDTQRPTRKNLAAGFSPRT
jgi:hypothetical protein